MAGKHGCLCCGVMAAMFNSRLFCFGAGFVSYDWSLPLHLFLSWVLSLVLISWFLSHFYFFISSPLSLPPPPLDPSTYLSTCDRDAVTCWVTTGDRAGIQTQFLWTPLHCFFCSLGLLLCFSVLFWLVVSYIKSAFHSSLWYSQCMLFIRL